MNAELDAHSTLGVLTETEIREGLTSGDVVIWPFEEHKLTPAGYDLTPSEWVYSLNARLLVPVQHEGGEKYCWIEPQDTVLLLTREAVRIPRYIAGTLLSKTSITGLGFSTTTMSLDSDWQGPLVLSLHNPTAHRLKFPLATLGEEGAVVEHTLVSLRLDLIRSFMGMPSVRQVARLQQLDVVLRPFPRKLNGFRKKQAALNACLREIAAIDFQAGQPEAGFDAEVFKRHYEESWKKIRFHTEQARKLSDQIHAQRRLLTGLRQTAFGVCMVAFLSYLGYQAVMFGDYTFLTFGLLLLGILTFWRK
ncbi:dCTP deaminase domain-containing protein [Tumebacillus permanentifrigoris]|uniref:Deoxycytidine triphosphate deaminase n=1 Tax=Tumebacillus permanentifrigoris TaxID=378543 RepID=A0A316DEH8_9BACL|nr:hypothetical protein [Tumebacillus permanentifrigoris]PWK16444.1 deoxycytidine triphosphate deaminase [Tumebacillus permanentifrigoris]